MTLQDWNPLGHFRELRLFSRTLFLLGFLFFGVALLRGVSPQNKLLFVSLSMIAFSLAAHYLAQWRYPVVINGRVSIKYSNILRGFVMLAVTGALLWWLWIIAGQPRHLP
jgi:hypothetical protein